MANTLADLTTHVTNTALSAQVHAQHTGTTSSSVPATLDHLHSVNTPVVKTEMDFVEDSNPITGRFQDAFGPSLILEEGARG